MVGEEVVLGAGVGKKGLGCFIKLPKDFLPYLSLSLKLNFFVLLSFVLSVTSFSNSFPSALGDSVVVVFFSGLDLII